MDKELESEVVDAIRQGKKIEAIKKLREIRNIGLKESKDLIDTYLNDNNLNNDNSIDHKSVEKLSSNNGLIIIIIIGATLYMAYKHFN